MNVMPHKHLIRRRENPLLRVPPRRLLVLDPFLTTRRGRGDRRPRAVPRLQRLDVYEGDVVRPGGGGGGVVGVVGESVE